MSHRFLILLSSILLVVVDSALAQDKPDDPRWNRSSVLLKTAEPMSPSRLDPNFKPNTTTRVVATPHEILLVEPNIRPRPNTGYHQSEVNIATHPLNRNIMFGASHNITNISPLKINVATFITTNGGQTWYGRDTLADFNTQRGDPAPMIDKNGVFIYGHLNSTANFGGVTGMGMNRSTDNGWTFEATIPIVNAGGSDADKNALGTDDNPASPYYGNSYMAWTKFTAASFPATILVTRTTNSGVSWSDAFQVNTAGASTFSQGTDVATGPNGDAYICWVEESRTSPYPSVSIGFAKSTDGGVAWTFNNSVYATSGMRSASYNGWAVRVNDFPRMAVHKSGGSRQGWIYVISAEQNLAPAGSDADVVLHRSTDGGTTWSAGIRVNQDPINNGKKQFFPSICVDQGGGINVAYYDNRDYASAGDSCEIYMSRSIDGGNTWADVQISDHAFRPKNVPGVNSMGDYMGIATGNAKVWPMWMDDRSGFYDVWTSSINVADPVDPNPPENVSAFSDYTTPTSMRLRWTRPTTLVNGTAIPAFVTRIKRNGVQIAERPQTDTTFIDTGLSDGTPYTYLFSTRLTGNDSLSVEMLASWIAGGSRIPKGPTNLAVTGTQASGYKIKWRNPSQQIDGTRLDDLAGIRLYRDGALATTLVRTSADTARTDSTLDNPTPGLHRYYVTAIDNELPVNESAQSNSGDTPIELPVQEFFATAGAPNSILWRNVNAVIDSDAVSEPSAPFSLNFAGNATGLGLDTVTSNSIDLTGRQGLGVKLGYWQQPQGGGDVPEAADSLITEALNDQGGWIALQKLPGAAVRPFQFVSFNMDSVSAGTGTFFFNGFKFRFRSKATTATTTRQDDWFVDDVFFGVPTGTPVMTVTPLNIVDTVLVGKRDSTRYSFAVSNTNSFGTALSYTVTESPAVAWLSASPTGGSVPGGSSNAIRVIINFTGVVQGNYTTRLIIASNAPANSADTVNINFRVNNAPIIGTQPASFTYNLHRGDSVTASLKIRNTGLGPLAYTSTVTGGFAGDTTTDVGSTQVNTTNLNLLRGGVVGVTRTVQLIEIKSYFGITAPVELRFVVYQNTTATGTFTKIFENTVMPAIDTAYFSSGPINITLQAGMFYAIGVNWNATLRYYWSTSPVPPLPISFGTITGGLASSVFPPPATLVQNATSSLYYTQIVTANGKWLNVTSNGSGTVNPGDSTLLGFKVTSASLPAGVANATLVVNSNDPVTPTVNTNVALTVITSVTERGSEIPLTYELSQNYPNPFNPTTRIEFALPEESTVRLKIYNILGQEIATLANEQRPAGYFVAEWNATNNAGAKVSSGVYFYKMEANSVNGESSFQSLKKMLILK